MVSLFEQNDSFLDTLRPQERTAFLGLGVERSYEPGEALMREGGQTSYVVAILRGWSTVSTDTKRGSRLILALRGAGEVVGDLAAVDCRPRSATVTALGSLHGVVVPGERFRRFLDEHPAATTVVLRQLSSRLRSSDGERRALAAETVLQRLAARLMEMVDRAGAPETGSGGGVAIDLPLPQHDLAAAVGSTREAVAKALRLLREQGVVRTSRRHLVVADLELLALLAEGGGSRPSS